jgi:hypothetical protein
VLGAVAALTLLLIYGGAYLSLVDRRVSLDNPLAAAEYRVGGAVVSSFFLPAHTVDRLIRPRYWTVGGRSIDPYDFETFQK